VSVDDYIMTISEVKGYNYKDNLRNVIWPLGMMGKNSLAPK